MIGNGDLLEAVGKKVTSLLVAPVADARHGTSSSEASAHWVVDTVGLPPAWLNCETDTYLDSVVAIGMEALELVGLLFHDLKPV